MSQRIPGAMVAVFLAIFALAACGPDERRAFPSLRSDAGAERLARVGTLDRERPSRPELSEHPIAELRLHRSLGDSASFSMVTAIVPFDRFLVVADPEIPPQLKTVDLESGAVIHSFGSRGEGPGEFMDPRFLARVSEHPPTVQVFDFQNRRLTRYGLSADGTREELQKTLPVTVDVPILQATPLPEGDGYLANGLFRDYSLVVLDTAGRDVGHVSTDPPFTEADFGTSAPLGLANLKRVAADLDDGRYAMAYQNTSRIDLLASPTGPVRTAWGPREPAKKVEIVNGSYIQRNGDEKAYVSVYATRRRVYALYCECPSDDSADHWGHPSYQVEVFDWNGAYLGELEMDHGILQVAVSDDDSLLWGTYEDPIPFIGEWALPDWVRDGPE